MTEANRAVLTCPNCGLQMPSDISFGPRITTGSIQGSATRCPRCNSPVSMDGTFIDGKFVLIAGMLLAALAKSPDPVAAATEALSVVKKLKTPNDFKGAMYKAAVKKLPGLIPGSVADLRMYAIILGIVMLALRSGQRAENLTVDQLIQLQQTRQVETRKSATDAGASSKPSGFRAQTRAAERPSANKRRGARGKGTRKRQ